MTHHSCCYDLENVISLLIGTIGGATTFASAKVKNAIGRIGIFLPSICLILYTCSDKVVSQYWAKTAHRLNVILYIPGSNLVQTKCKDVGWLSQAKPYPFKYRIWAKIYTLSSTPVAITIPSLVHAFKTLPFIVSKVAKIGPYPS